MEAGGSIFLVGLFVFLIALNIAMIVAFFQIRTNTANTCDNLVISNQQLIAIRKLLEANSDVESTNSAVKSTISGGHLPEVDLAMNFLTDMGYKVKTQAGKFKIHEPAGGKTGWKTTEELVEYAKERGCRL